MILYFISYEWTETFNGRTIICFYWISAMTINWLTGKNTRLSEAQSGGGGYDGGEWVCTCTKKKVKTYFQLLLQSQQTVNRTIRNWKFKHLSSVLSECVLILMVFPCLIHHFRNVFQWWEDCGCGHVLAENTLNICVRVLDNQGTPCVHNRIGVYVYVLKI